MPLALPEITVQQKVVTISDCLDQEINIMNHLVEKQTQLINAALDNAIA